MKKFVVQFGVMTAICLAFLVVFQPHLFVFEDEGEFLEGPEDPAGNATPQDTNHTITAQPCDKTRVADTIDTNHTMPELPLPPQEQAALCPLRKSGGCPCILKNYLLIPTTGPTAPYPLIHYTYMRTQGMGRVLIHGMRTFAMAVAIGRPFLLDLRDRDPRFRFRSFIELGDYNSAPSSYFESLSNQLKAAMMKSNGKEQKSPQTPSDRQSLDLSKLNTTERDEILKFAWPMETGKGNHSYRMTQWAASNPETKKKVLFSPNWGLAWFTQSEHKALDTMLAKRGCSFGAMTPYLHKLLWRPTTLLKAMFRIQKQAVLGEEWVHKPFGTIHLRSVFVGKMPANYAENIKECIDSVEGVERWWLIGDGGAQQYFPNITRAAQGKIFTGNSGSSSDPKLLKRNSHSASDGFPIEVIKDLDKLLDRVSGSTSYTDWMALNEASTAFVTKGAFGESGATGNLKHKQRNCAFFGVYQADDPNWANDPTYNPIWTGNREHFKDRR